MRRPRAEDVYQVRVPSDDEMNKWTREIIQRLASENPRVSKTKVAILNSRVKRDYAYAAIQRKWHGRLGKLATGLFVTWFFGGFFFAALLTGFIIENTPLSTDSFLVAVLWLPLVIFLMGYVITGLSAAADRGHEAFLFRKRLLWIDDPKRASELLDNELSRDTPVASKYVRIPWVWKFW